MIAITKAIVLDLLLAYLFYDSWIAGVVLLPVQSDIFSSGEKSAAEKRNWNSVCSFEMQCRSWRLP